MRLRNIKGSKEKLLDSPFVINEPSNYKGKYHELFKNSNPIHLEIGTGKGGFISNMAKKNPHINYIGLEKEASVLVKALPKLEKLNNLKLMVIDAINIDEIFNKEIATIYLNFSDPWPKKKHAMRRLTSPVFLTKYDSILTTDGRLELKTDNQKLFEYSIVSLSNFNYKIEKMSLNLYEDLDPDNIATEYEKKFVSKGMAIYQVKAIRQCLDK